MQNPAREHGILYLPELSSTQDLAMESLRAGPKRQHGAVVAGTQTAGRGRFGRIWHSPQNESLAVSLSFTSYPNHPEPFLIGMAVAIAAAQALKIYVSWPNDLVFEGRKVGGILTEMCFDKDGRNIAVVGLGLNLNQEEFDPEIQDIASSIKLVSGKGLAPLEALELIGKQLESLPNPTCWEVLRPFWEKVDRTPGKQFKLPDGRIAIAEGVDERGWLFARCEGLPLTVTVADALWGQTPNS